MKHIHKASRHFMQGHDVGLTGGENREEVGKGGGRGEVGDHMQIVTHPHSSHLRWFSLNK